MTVKDEKAPRRAPELPEHLQALAPYERPSGAPFVPSSGAPATRTGRPAQHAGSDQRIVMCPLSAVIPGTKQCQFIGAIRVESVRDHLIHEHRWAVNLVDDYLADPWYGDEARSVWKDRTYYRRYGRRGPINQADGTPDAASFAKLLDGLKGSRAGMAEDRDTPSLRCPVSIDCAYSALPPTYMRKHLIDDYGWSQERTDDWLEQHEVKNASLIPAVLEEAMAAREANRRGMEEAMTDMFAEDKVEVDPELTRKLVPNELEALLTEWWMDKAEEEVRAVVPKAVAYGSNSLLQLGRKMAQLQGREVSDEEAMELGCWVYVVGKVERWTDAVMRGERPSDDSIYDIGIYVKMTQRLRDVGSWPGVPQD